MLFGAGGGHRLGGGEVCSNGLADAGKCSSNKAQKIFLSVLLIAVDLIELKNEMQPLKVLWRLKYWCFQYIPRN